MRVKISHQLYLMNYLLFFFNYLNTLAYAVADGKVISLVKLWRKK